ncbi:4-aminobutyrate aminotransferase / (S)-3-amino-2-methylpropionate transaminase [Stigmatella aurantiaca]|uniref:4-aminobutyrate aminotransferase / (S)-3-amino-2-methylpropionate transaminase n=1 Tax=Stigmatella aurantiaca TaxID=41 RepID=A0A1H7Z828_STIAU|nr:MULTISPECIES: aspartate aminotransferase family protein [Stigmatella]SEM54415.1 4-aminobutyrate aminotransferase / (S)-3-amino-2-methylpropionate transaminase [Stigmatella aurantiaca]
MSTEDILQTERRYLNQGISEEAALGGVAFTHGRGTLLFDAEGKQYLDMSAGIFTQSTGHGHPHVTGSMHRQLDRLWNVHDFPTDARAALCEKLAQHFPEHLQTFAFFTTGAEAIEAAIRAVFGAVPPQRQRLAALRYGFHGKTMGARMLVHWDVGTTSFSGNSVLGYPGYCYRCPLGRTYPSCEMQCAQLVNKHISSKKNIAALFFEPIQGAAGVIVPPLEYWPMIQEECRKNGVLLVADEIVTGGGRTGEFLACSLFNVQPDIVAAAKGLSSGFPFSMLAGRKSLLNEGEFAQGGAASSTFGGNPLSMTAARATLEVLESEQLLDRVKRLGARLREGLLALKADFPFVGDARGVGLLYALEFVTTPQGKEPDAAKARFFFRRCMELGVKTCVGGHIIRMGPPFTVSEQELEQALDVFGQVLKQMHDQKV